VGEIALPDLCVVDVMAELMILPKLET